MPKGSLPGLPESPGQNLPEVPSKGLLAAELANTASITSSITTNVAITIIFTLTITITYTITSLSLVHLLSLSPSLSLLKQSP